MAVTIRAKRGTEAQILAGTLAIGEIAFATDTKALFTYDGVSKQLLGKVILDTFDHRPTAAVAGRLFFATDTGLLYFDNGSIWTTGPIGPQGTQK